MNKKTRLAIIALIALTFSAASTYAYFTSEYSLPTSGSGNLKLEITNGTVQIKAGAGSSYSPVWTYDVATGGGINDRSPDILGFDASDFEPVSGVSRLKLNSILKGIDIDSSGTIEEQEKGIIKNARPGDALVLKAADGNTVQAGATGLEILNESNLTIKCEIGIKNVEKLNTQLTNLYSIGWVLSINDKTIYEELGKYKVTGLTDEFDTFDAAITTFLDDINDTLSDNLNQGTKKDSIKIKLELPLIKDNNYQGLDTSGMTAGFQIGELFTIRATQENNPNWNETGN